MWWYSLDVCTCIYKYIWIMNWQMENNCENTTRHTPPNQKSIWHMVHSVCPRMNGFKNAAGYK